MGIFKNITKTLKQAAPVIGSAIGMYIGGPAGYAALGGALGGGIGSLVGGGDKDDALTAALLGGIGGYAAQGSFAGTGVPPGREVVGAVNRGGGSTGGYSGFNQVKGFESVPIKEPGIMSKIGTFAKENPFTTAGIAGLGLTALGGEEEKPIMGSKRPDPVGRSRLGIGLVGDKSYNLDDEDERNQYFEDLRKQQGVTPTKFVAGGGEITGPGTGTSDSVPARLSDGEFVLTAKSVRGAGGGDRDLGAARMYDMMSKLERVA
jgi:hypothetical protein